MPHSDSKEKKITIAIIEDNKKVRDSVVQYLSMHSDMHILRTFGSAESYFDHFDEFPEFKSQVLLLDIGLPGQTGLDAITYILKLQPDLDIIMLTTYEENKILKAMAAGAVAYISKRAPLESIVEAIRVVNKGGSYMSPMIARELFNVMVRDTRNSVEIVTTRQREILELLVERKSYSQIATHLFISVDTVKSHIKKLYKTLNVNSKNEAIALYLEGKVS